jgi:hypothetical protein
MTVFLGYFNAKVCREGIFMSAKGNGSLCEISNYKRIRVVNIAT